MHVSVMVYAIGQFMMNQTLLYYSKIITPNCIDFFLRMVK